MGTIRENLQRIRERVQQCAADAGRRPDDVLIVAVSKTFGADAVSEAAEAGQLRFGENRVQEAELKIPALGYRGLEWHLVGHLQSNKTRRAADLFHMVESIDGARVASRLSEAGLESRRQVPVLLQVDLGGEPTKFGVDPNRLPELLDSMAGMSGIRIEGLMTIPPYCELQDDARPFFARLRELRDSLMAQAPGCLGRGHLSMGMSHDFEAAILEGATIVRIGTAIFGERS